LTPKFEVLVGADHTANHIDVATGAPASFDYEMTRLVEQSDGWLSG
jgi:hypothetical protein